MSIFVYFDEHAFKVTNLTRHDRLSDLVTEKIGGERSLVAPLLEDRSPSGRSAAHPRRYAEHD